MKLDILSNKSSALKVVHRADFMQEKKGGNCIDYGARFYDPSIGRFLSVDPQADANSLAPWSPYHYVYNNPLSYTDPTGEFPVFLIPVIVAAIEAATAAAAAEALLATSVVLLTAAVIHDNVDLSTTTTSGTPAPSGDGGLTETVAQSAALEMFEQITPAIDATGISPIEFPDFSFSSIQEFKKIGSHKDANKAAEDFGYEGAEDLKGDYGVGSDYNIYRDGKTGDLELRPNNHPSNRNKPNIPVEPR